MVSKNQIYPADKDLGSLHQPVTTMSQTELTSGPSRATHLSISPALIFELILHPTIHWEKGCNTGQLLGNRPVNWEPFKSSALLEDTAPKLQILACFGTPAPDVADQQHKGCASQPCLALELTEEY